MHLVLRRKTTGDHECRRPGHAGADAPLEVAADALGDGVPAAIPLEVRFLHDPAKSVWFVGAALSGVMWRAEIDKNNPRLWVVRKYVELPALKVTR